MVYLFIGQDSLEKDKQLKALRQEFLPKETEQFNLDILYSKDLALKELQEKLLCLPVRSPKRLVAVKDAQGLREDIKEFILGYAKAPHKQIVLVLDMDRTDKKDVFVSQLQRFAKIFRFKEALLLDTFSLSRQITLKKADSALRILNQLLKDGERPERILGGLRYVWERETASALEAKRRLKLLVDCDMEIKTGRLKPVFALEKLVISLCGFGKPLR